MSSARELLLLPRVSVTVLSFPANSFTSCWVATAEDALHVSTAIINSITVQHTFITLHYSNSLHLELCWIGIIEITCYDHSIIACSCHIYMGDVLCAHPVRGELHVQRNANRELATTSLPFTINRTDRMFFLRRLHLAWPSHPGHSTILLQLKSASGKCAKLHTVPASNNRAHMPWSLITWTSFCFGDARTSINI